jgi:hypothetical protein
MKKALITLIFLSVSNLVNAQFKINSNNKVGINSEPNNDVQLFIKVPTTLYAGLHMDSQGQAPYQPGIQVQGSENSILFSGYQKTLQTFIVYANGTVWSQYGYLLYSDARLKNNVEPLTNSLEKIKKLKGVSYSFKTQNVQNHGYKDDSTLVQSFKTESSFQSAIQSNSVTNEIIGQIEKEKLVKRIGLIAQDVEKVVPEVVKTSHNGLKGIAYSDLVALLIEGIKEQQLQIEQLREQISVLKNDGSGIAKPTNNLNDLESNSMKAKLFQNAPNPFNTETVIKYYVPTTVKKARIYIFNTEGKRNKSIEIDIKGEASVKIASNELSRGLYFYSLILDDQIVDSKTMLITE